MDYFYHHTKFWNNTLDPLAVSSYHRISYFSPPLYSKTPEYKWSLLLISNPYLPFSLELVPIRLCPQHSTKTPLVQVTSDPSVASSLDLSAALDMADHSLLLKAFSPFCLLGCLCLPLSLSFFSSLVGSLSLPTSKRWAPMLSPLHWLCSLSRWL